MCCVCDSSITLPPIIVYMPTIYTQSCDYTAIPSQDSGGNRTVPTITSGLFNGPSLGSTYASTPTPLSPLGSATITMGESSVHVSALTSTALFTSILASACPPAATATECSQDPVVIPGIEFKDINKQLNYGELKLQVQASNYTDDVTQRGKYPYSEP